MSIEDKMPGRVLLSEFYAKGLHGQWKFTEKVDYLRSLGALDESVPDKPRVIVPNYVGSRPQCLEASGLYSVCCPNECEAMMGKLEIDIAEPTALPETIISLVQSMASSSIAAPRVLADSLVGKLFQVAAAHGGRVPLHGRLFAQWMHHAFPRECPFPHTTGSTSPQTPDEWMRNTGHESTDASEEEMVCHVSGPCAGGSNALSSTQSDDLESIEIPWSDDEELLVRPHSFGEGKTHSLSDAVAGGTQHRQFNGVIRTFVLAGVAFGLACATKLSPKDVKKHTAGWWTTRLLLVLPLLIVSIDYFIGFSVVNEFFLCGLCWAMAALTVSDRVHFGTVVQMLSADQCEDMRWKEKCAV